MVTVILIKYDDKLAELVAVTAKQQQVFRQTKLIVPLTSGENARRKSSGIHKLTYTSILGATTSSSLHYSTNFI